MTLKNTKVRPSAICLIFYTCQFSEQCIAKITLMIRIGWDSRPLLLLLIQGEGLGKKRNPIYIFT